MNRLNHVSLGIAEHYFEFSRPDQPGDFTHRSDCPLAGTGMWEISHTSRSGHLIPGMDDGDTLLVLRMLCRQCGAVHLMAADGRDQEITTVDQIGYGTRPERAAGLWLHAGPLLLPECGDSPRSYYVTGSPQAPLTPDEVIGLVSSGRGRRGGTTWSAAYGLRRSNYGYVAERRAETPFRSRTAAAKWLADQHGRALAEASA